MLKRFIIFTSMCFIIMPAFGFDESVLEKENSIQTRIDSVGTNLLNCNKILRRIVFTYGMAEKKKMLSTDKSLTKRQVIIYSELYRHVQTDDELAAMLAREISTVMKSYSGIWGGTLDSVQVALGSKKFEMVADKRAVDYMVNAGYNPLALIVFINKTCPQKRFDKISRHNLTSRRLAHIYEYITYKYPQFLENNEYINNPYYQNFLLTSIENRRRLEEKMKNKSLKEVKYD